MSEIQFKIKHIILFKGFDKIVKMLVDGGAIDTENNENTTALLYAAERGKLCRSEGVAYSCSTIMTCLVTHNSTFFIHLFIGYERIVRILMRESSGVNAAGDPVLVVAIMKGKPPKYKVFEIYSTISLFRP